MTRLLFKKMIGDMRASLAAYILCAMVLMLGLCGYSVLELCYDNLTVSRDLFFRQSDYCDGFVETVYTDLSVTRRLEEIEGIAVAEGRLVRDIQMVDTADRGEAELHLVSWEKGQMNRPVLSRGTLPEQGKAEMVIGEGMAKARNLRPGDTIWVVAGGRQIEMKITGVGMTPENIYMIRDMNELFPNPANYDAAFTSYETASWLMDQRNCANSFLLRLNPDTSWDMVKDSIEQVTVAYGFQAAYEGTEQTGAAMLEEEIKQLERMSGVVPFLFLSVASVVLAITLSRMVEQQRTQIGTLMALGVSGNAIRFHYMGYGAVVGFVGGTGGTLLGYLVAAPMADFYRMYFSLPSANAPLRMIYLVSGSCISTLFCGGISWMIAGGVRKLEPARALRPASPGAGKPSMLERIPGFMKLFTIPGIMAIRSLSRNRKRTVFSLIGMSIAYMLTATLVSMNTMFDVFIFDYWEKNQRQDMMVYFDHPVGSIDAMEAIRHPQVLAVEGILEFSVTLAGTAGKMDCMIQAIAPDSDLIRLYRTDGTRAGVLGEGILISEHAARILGVGRGDVIEVRTTYPEKKNTAVMVSDVIAQYMGNTAYLSYDGAANVSGYRNVYTGVFLKAPSDAAQVLQKELEGKGAVSLIQSKGERLNQYRAILGSMSGIMLSMSLMGVATGFIVVFVSSLIRYEELKRELATMMLLGMNSKECLEVLSTSQWILTIGAIILGIPLAIGTGKLMSITMSGELFTLPSMLSGSAVLGSIGLISLSVVAGSAMMLKKLRKLSPVDFLRERE